MAKITFKAGEDFAIKLSALADRSEEIVAAALKAGAAPVADRIRANLEANLKDQEYVGKREGVLFKKTYSKPTGALLKSFGITPVKKGADGWWTVKIGVEGYDPRGIPNALKARVMESGSSAIRKRPFVRPAVNATKKAAVAAMQDVIDSECKKTMKG